VISLPTLAEEPFSPWGAWESAGEGEVGIPPWKLEYEQTMSRKSEVNSLFPILIALILATTVYFPSMTLTLHKSQIHCSGIMP